MVFGHTGSIRLAREQGFVLATRGEHTHGFEGVEGGEECDESALHRPIGQIRGGGPRSL